MKLLVRYSAQLREALGRAEEELDLPPGSSLETLLLALAERNLQAAAHLVGDSRRPRPSLLVVINDRAVPTRQAAATELQPNDIVMLLPPIAGG